MVKPELLAPAGDMSKLRMALAYGADAVYMAAKKYGMRAAAGNFDEGELREAAELVRSYGAKAYLTINTVAHENELAGAGELARLAADCGFDAAIVADMGVLDVVKSAAPNLAVHMSTQAGITNSASARMWHSLGAARVILARELSLDEIASIRANTPSDLEIEVFVHGAMCVSFSGRCLLSNYMTGRDGNRGECAQPCRWKYHLVEERTPGEYFEIQEHPEGSYIMNSRDLCAIEFLDKLADAGVSSLKIEGRAKSEYYAAAVTRAYRGALDDLIAGRPFDPAWREELEKTSHRPYCNGFFFGLPKEGIQYTGDARYIRDWEVAAVVERTDGDWAYASLKNPFEVGEPLELLRPNAPVRAVTVGEIFELDGEGEERSVFRATKNQFMHKLKLPGGCAQAILRKPKK